MDLEAEEKALMEMAAAVRLEIDQAPMPAPMPEAVQPAPAPAPAPVQMPAPLAAQAAALGEALARAPMAAPPKMTTSISPFGARDTFIPRAPVEPKIEVRQETRTEPRFEMSTEAKTPIAELPLAAPPTVAAAPAKADPGRIRLFDRYRSLTARPKVEEAPAAPQPQAKVDRPQAGMSTFVNPQDRPVTSHSEDELEIPAFLRRQAN